MLTRNRAHIYFYREAFLMQKRILMITTGGTIACRETARGLSPVLDGAALLSALPALSEVCSVETLELMQLDSTDVTAEDRLRMAHTVWENRERCDGFVLTHGTDTLAYTAALLTHLLPDLDKPLMLTGSMLPIGADGSDAPRNLLDAFRAAADGRNGVYAVMNGTILHGSHVFKQHSAALDAFISANAAPAGTVQNGIVRWNEPAAAPHGAPRLIEQLDTHILPIYLTPDLAPSFFSALAGYPTVVLQTFGGGGVPQRLEAAVRELIESGTRVYITTQCPEGGVHLHKYEVGQRAEALGAVSLENRTFADALAALMCGEL